MSNVETTPQPAPIAGRAVVAEMLSSLWWLMLLRGVILVVLGGYALSQPGMTMIALAQVLAIFVIIDGVLAIVAGVMGWTESRGWTLARGALAIVVGGFVLAHPVVMGVIAAMTILFLLAFQSILCGMMEITVAIQQRKEMEGEGWLILGGVLSIIFGILLMSAPMLAAEMLVRVIGVFAIIFGVALIINSFRVRKLGKRLEAPS